MCNLAGRRLLRTSPLRKALDQSWRLLHGGRLFGTVQSLPVSMTLFAYQHIKSDMSLVLGCHGWTQVFIIIIIITGSPKKLIYYMYTAEDNYFKEYLFSLFHWPCIGFYFRVPLPWSCGMELSLLLTWRFHLASSSVSAGVCMCSCGVYISGETSIPIIWLIGRFNFFS